MIPVGIKGSFTDSLDSIVLEDPDRDRNHNKIHVLRQTDYYLNNATKLNIFVMYVPWSTPLY